MKKFLQKGISPLVLERLASHSQKELSMSGGMRHGLFEPAPFKNNHVLFAKCILKPAGFRYDIFGPHALGELPTYVRKESGGLQTKYYPKLNTFEQVKQRAEGHQEEVIAKYQGYPLPKGYIKPKPSIGVGTCLDGVVMIKDVKPSNAFKEITNKNENKAHERAGFDIEFATPSQRIGLPSN